MFDVTPLSVPRTGIGNYLRGTLAGLAEAADGAHEIVAFAATGPRGLRAIPAALEGIQLREHILFLPLARAWRIAWSRLGRPALERVVGRFDALHYSDWWYPPQRGGLRTTTVHDLIPLHFPDWVHPRTRRLHAPKYRDAARTCDVVFVNSAFTRRDVVETLGVPEERVRVAYPGVAPVFRPDGGGGDYVLGIASNEPRKNLDALVEAHRLLGGGIELVLAGEAGYVEDEELARLYRGAAVFVYPSRFEGFGIPVLEAMTSGVPVVASSHPSLDEACGDAAVRADPDSPEELAAAIERALSERDELVRRGLAHARGFTWSRMGRVFLDTFLEAAP